LKGKGTARTSRADRRCLLLGKPFFGVILLRLGKLQDAIGITLDRSPCQLRATEESTPLPPPADLDATPGRGRLGDAY
jgi:hypothetical protein